MVMSEIIKRIKYVKLKDYLSGIQFLLALPISLFLKWKRPHIWLVCEDENEARDNGYCFYKYLRKEHPEIDAVYAINMQAPYYEKVKDLGQTISYGTFLHWIYYLAAEYNISSQKGGKPNAAICYFLEIYGIWKNQRIFLQHGITKDDAKWLYYDVTKFSKFICGAKPEYDFVKEKFGYPEGNVVYTGFARFDDWHNAKVKHNRILIIPSWREWLTDNVRSYAGNSEVGKPFQETTYYKAWNGFLNNKHFIEMIKDNDLEVIFYPHRNMQKYLAEFHVDKDYIILADSKDWDIQDLLKTSVLMITDYSSVFFDFYYMKKSVIFYQFDIEAFRNYQYADGWLDYANTSVGEQASTEEGLLNLMECAIQREFQLSSNAQKRHEDMFSYYDQKNCKRIFEVVKGGR